MIYCLTKKISGFLICESQNYAKNRPLIKILKIIIEVF